MNKLIKQSNKLSTFSQKVSKTLPLFILILSIFLISLSSVMAVGTYPAVDPNMVLYYHFNNQSAYGENDTRIYDFSGNGNNGTVTGDSKFINGGGYLLDGSFEFNTSNRINARLNMTSLVNNFSFSFWINTYTSDTAYRDFLISDKSPGNGSFVCYIMKPSTTSLYCSFKNNTGSSFEVYKTALNTNTWYYVTVTGSANSLILYLNGVSSMTLPYNGNIFYNGTQIYVGSNGNGDFNGSIDELIFYNKSLSSDEVWSNYITYIQCLNISSVLTGVRGYSPICPYDYEFNTSYILSVSNNTYINFTGSYFHGNGSGPFIELRTLSNVTLDGLNASGYTYILTVKDNSNYITIDNAYINNQYNGFMIFDNSNNILINNSKFGYDSYNNPQGLYFRYSGTNHTIINSYLKNCIGCVKYYNLRGFDHLIKDTYLGGNSSFLSIIVNSTNILYNNVTFNDSNSNYDSYNVGLSIYSWNGVGTSNITVFNSKFENIGCVGILAQGVDKHSPINTFLSQKER